MEENDQGTTIQIQKTVEATIDGIDKITGLDKDDTEALWKSRTKMAWLALWGMIIPTLYIILRVTDVDLVDKFGVLLSWYYLSLASIVGAFFGFQAWATIKGK